MSILEQIDSYIDGDEDYDDETFSKMADFLISLTNEQEDMMSDEQRMMLESIYDELDFDDIDMHEIRLAQRTKSQKRMQTKRYYRTHKSAIKRKKSRFKRSAAGKQRSRMTNRMAKSGKTATGRKIVKYH